MVECYAIIAGGGASQRFGQDLPKPFVPVNGVPMIIYSIESFMRLSIPVHVIIPSDHEDRWLAIAQQYHLSDVTYSFGQPTRYLSVQTALKNAPPSRYVLIHDAARPLFSPDSVQDILQALTTHPACILGAPVVDTLKKCTDGLVSATVPREDTFHAQTPMGFDRSQLTNLMAQNNDHTLTDESQLFEHHDQPIHVISSHHPNFKITYPDDLALAEYLITTYREPGPLIRL